MSQTSEVKAFIQRIASLPPGPSVSLDGALQPSLDDEAELRRLFATDKTNTRLTDPHVGLVDVFDAPVEIRTTRARIVKDEVDLSAHHVMPLADTKRRKEGTPAMVADLDEFKKNWGVFTENSLSQLFDWNNVVAAGGAVLACLSPLPDFARVSKRAIRKYFHSAAYPTSDVDLFLWGMTPEQAEVKINSIYEAVRDSVPWDVTCVRTKHTVSIHSQYPYRSVQIVLRLYNSPAEILAGFDIDAPCCIYDGARVWANPRAIVAMMRQANTVDMTRRSPSYEIRLAKYSSRDFEVYVPALRRDDVDPTIYERSIIRIEGLARLLVLEKLTDTTTRLNFLQSRRTLRGRPSPPSSYRRRNKKYKGDLKADTTIGGLEMNDYDVASLHIPYGPGWDARRVDKLVYQTDLGMNSTFNPKNKKRKLHRHPAFFGTMKECIEDCCEYCPEPTDDEEKKLQEDEDKQYIRGRVAFIEENPGRQSISGSFNPIDEGEWSAQAYIGPTEKLFAAIVAQDRVAVAKMVVNGIDVNRRDHVGRTPLHVAIMTKASDVACDLIDAGARMTWRLVDGRTSLHMAAQLDLLVVVRKLLERSAFNKEKAEKVEREREVKQLKVVEGGDKEREEEEDIRDSSEDDWDSEESDRPVVVKKPPTKTESKSGEEADILEDEEDAPDIFDINAPDWDHAFTPLSYAILYASLPVIEELLRAGADVQLVTKAQDFNCQAFHPLSLTILTEDERHATKVAERLLLAGASSSSADQSACTIFYRVVCSGRTELASALLRLDPNSGAVINFPSVGWNSVIFPIVAALASGNYSMVALLVVYGAKLVPSEEDVTRAEAAGTGQQRRVHYRAGNNNPMHGVFSPAETALSRHDDVLSLLVALGANVDLGIKLGIDNTYATASHLSLLDWVRIAERGLSQQILTKEQSVLLSEPQPNSTVDANWKGCYGASLQELKTAQSKKAFSNSLEDHAKTLHEMYGIKDYLGEVEQLLVEHNARTWSELYPDQLPGFVAGQFQLPTPVHDVVAPSTYMYHGVGYSPLWVPKHLTAVYDELYEACFTGDNAKIQQLCFPPNGSTIPPIQISVQTAKPQDRWAGPGFTPLYVAISRRNWETARLVLAIAVGQYHPDDKEEAFSMRDVVLDDDSDSDDESEGSCDSDETIDEQNAVNFIDVAKIPSQVRCDIRPQKMLCDVHSEWVVEKGLVLSANLLHKTIIDGDLETFVHIADLYKTISEPLTNHPTTLEAIIANDRAEMLDEFIRRTGSGIDVSDDSDEASFARNKSRLYLGLSVHGKKRKDLAKKNDPNAAHREDFVVPLLWKAVRAHALTIVTYLSGERPLAAYRFYSSTNSDDRAERLRKTANLDTVLPEWLGWHISTLKESPLTAAVLGNKLDTLKMLFEKSPKLMRSALHERIKFLGYNSLMLAVERGCNTELVDYLLAKGISPTETDLDRCWNIFHLLCYSGHSDLLEHLLQKLPAQTVEHLLAQQSKRRLNTPLHIAVKLGKTRAVRYLLESKKCNLLLRNVNGYTPLHVAAQEGFVEITGLIIGASPQEALHCENGVGEVPLEIASQQDLLWRTRQKFIQSPQPSALPSGAQTKPPRFGEQAGVEVTNLKATLDELVCDGVLRKDTTLAKELFAFADTMQIKLSQAKPTPKGSPAKEDKDPKDRVDRMAVLQLIREAVSVSSGVRQLLHVLDVQKSVHGDLAKSQLVAGQYMTTRNKYDDGLEPEEEVEQQERRRSLVFGIAGQRVDPL